MSEGFCGCDETFYYYGHHQKIVWKQQTVQTAACSSCTFILLPPFLSQIILFSAQDPIP
jgi:hypothetical protein